MINVEELKNNIIQFLEDQGPSIPVKIAKEIEQEPVFTSALLGELTNTKKVNTSNMRVGSSQIYFLPGQEQKLETFAEEFLGGVVKHAYLELKEKKYLIDKDEEPKVRVALRSLKDFATPFMHEGVVMWRYNFANKEEISQLINGKRSSEKPKREELRDARSKIQTNQEPETQTTLSKESKDEESVKQKTVFVKKPFASPVAKSEPKQKKESVFASEVINFLKSKDVKLTEELEVSRNEFVGIVEVQSDLGNMLYLVIARNKKTINDSDLRVAKSRAHEKNMPCYLLHKGKLTKGAKEFLSEVENLVKIGVIE